MNMSYDPFWDRIRWAEEESGVYDDEDEEEE